MTRRAPGDGLPAVLPSVLRALRPRRRPPWQHAGTFRVAARGVPLRAEHVAAFVEVCGGPPPPAVPLTYPYALLTPLHAAALAAPAFPLAPLGLVHRSESVTRHEALRVGDVVDAQVEVGGFRATPGGVSFEVHTTVSREGRVVWESHGTAVRRTASGAPPPYLGDALREGREERWVVPADTGRRYGRVARNLDPIHVSALTARLFGFKRAVVHGMWTLARAVSAIGEPEGKAAVEVRFRSPLPLPAAVRFVAGPDRDATRFAVWPEQGERPIVAGRLHA